MAPSEADLEMIEINEVARLCDRSRRAVFNLRNPKSRFYDATFPDPLMWGKRHMWRKQDVLAWKAKQIATTTKRNAEKLKGVDDASAA